MIIDQLLLPILASGVIILTHHPYHKKFLSHYDGQLLYIKAAEMGLLMYAFVNLAAWMIQLLLASHSCSLLIHFWRLGNYETARTIGWSGGLLILAWIWCSVAGVLLKLQQMKWKKFCTSDLLPLALLRCCVARGSLEEIFFCALLTQRPLLIQLQSGSVYCGFVEQISGLTHNLANKQLFTIRLVGVVGCLPLDRMKQPDTLAQWLDTYPALTTITKSDILQVADFSLRALNAA